MFNALSMINMTLCFVGASENCIKELILRNDTDLLKSAHFNDEMLLSKLCCVWKYGYVYG